MKHAKHFDDGTFAKKCFLAASESLFSIFKNKSERISATRDVLLSRPLDESVGGVDSPQVMIFVSVILSHLNVKHVHTILTLKDTKLASITNNGMPGTVGKHNEFITLCANDESFPPFLKYHCIMHQQVLCGHILKMAHIMSIVTKIVNSVCSQSLQRRNLRLPLEEFDTHYGDLEEDYSQVYDMCWLLDLAFVTNLTAELNDLNKELQGKKQTIRTLMFSVVFQPKI
ncbi:general transcription factor II-I repeat domain-containing protein 2A-like [Schistocerca gregaria]|uniref:general transcription factor II-I repeat domain-containing protein 2A-like n=1 Tax=Schistocerca gregaria TaxID=7010 RepID=UPI00211F11B1|nr:general transcription factor II-I repeat domain-containing protein 2A-like [Schistocerca gregaria]